MFRKFSDQLSAAFIGGNRGEAAKIQQLVSLGVPEAAAAQALTATNGNVEQAAELLLNQPGMMTTSSTNRVSNGSNMSEEEQVRRAMQASLQVAPPSTKLAPRQNKTVAQRSAASSRAGQAALSRATGKRPPSSGNSSLSSHHPSVKVIPKLSEKPTEEQILRTTDRLKSSYAAVDTLLKAITAVQQDPTNPKFRTIDTTTAGYQRSLAGAVGATDFLAAMMYRPIGPKLVLDAANVDPALLFLGISALEQTKLTTEYQLTKGQAVLAKSLQTIRAEGGRSEVEAILRAADLSKCPAEPMVGKSANVQVTLGEEVVRRRFEGDDTLQDVLHWLGAHGSGIFQNLNRGEWVLLDTDRNVMLDVRTQANDTLQYLECWPSGRLRLTTQALVDLQP